MINDISDSICERCPDSYKECRLVENHYQLINVGDCQKTYLEGAELTTYIILKEG